MADQDIAKKARGGRASIDAAVALFAALAVGFAGYAMPAELFQRLFGAAAAVPDSTARIGAAGAAAVATLVLIFALLRALERIPSARRGHLAEMPADPPRLRRADAHPDAPSRLPVFARHELGAPIPAEQPEVMTPDLTEEVAEQPEEPAPNPVEEVAEQAAEELVLEEEQVLPSLLGAGLEISDGEPVERDREEAPEPGHKLPSFIAPVEAEVREEPVVALPEAPTKQDAGPIIEAITAEIEDEAATPIPEEPAPVAVVAEADPSPTVAEAPEPTLDEPLTLAAREPAEAEPITQAPAEQPDIPFADEAAAAEPQPAIDELGESLATPTEEPADLPPEARTDADAVEPIAALAARIPDLPQPRDESVSELMGRLEVGLSRGDRARWLGHSEAEAAPADDRLRGAIGMLRKMARKN